MFRKLGDDQTQSSSLDFRSTAPWRNLILRSEILKRLRSSFDAANYVEVETPLLSADSVVDRYIDPLPVTLFADGTRPSIGPTSWLQTSPEFGMKRLLADWYSRQSSDPEQHVGNLAIYQVARVFRAGETGDFHNPEFTMVEWYRQNQTYQQAIFFLSELINSLLQCGPAVPLTYQDAFAGTLDLANIHNSTAADLREVAIRRKLCFPVSMENADRDAWLNFLLAEVVEPSLGVDRPTILYDYPASQSALAAIRRDASGNEVACRFELYVSGIELANGYHELLDANELESRNRITNQQRQSDGKYPLPEQSRLLDAMRHGLPSCSGVALGLDRVIMLAANASHIDQVIAFPTDRA